MKNALHIFALSVLSMLLVSCDSVPETSITSNELIARIQKDSAPLILDVRTESEFAKSHIPGAVNVPHQEIEKRLSDLPVNKSTEIVVHCKSGPRAEIAEEILSVAGYRNVKILTGNFDGWSESDLPVEHGITR